MEERLSRRKLLGGIGVGAAALAVRGVAAAAPGRDRRPDHRRAHDGRQQGRGADARASQVRAAQSATSAGPGRFSRMFADHPPFVEPDDELREMLAEIGKPGGMLDANDPLEVGPIRLITEPELSPNNLDNPTHTAGTTFVGQFVDHDLTSDAGSTLGQPTAVARSVNMRTPRLDLDSVYGGGPLVSPALYRPDDPTRFRIESGGLFEDVPRQANHTAIIADGRNDENLIVSGLHGAMLSFHNSVVDLISLRQAGDEDIFAAAQQLVRWHYQWTIVNEFIPQIVGDEMTRDVLENGPRFFTDPVPAIPVEFQTAAYRFGHSMVRPSYRANLAGDNGEAFFAFVFDPDEFNSGSNDPGDLSGGHRAPRRFIGWQTFFDFGDGEVKPNKRIDTSLSTPLFQLPLGTIATRRGEPIGPSSLATRNLLRHITWGIPSGQQVAASMGADQLSDADLDDFNSVAPRLRGATPLWLYILREAEVVEDGLHLGPVGGRIVAEVILGLLSMDPTSYLGANLSWQPTLESRATSHGFGMADVLAIAGVDPRTRGQ